MDFILSKVTQQAMNYAIRSGITITSGFAIQQCSRLLKTHEGQGKDELETLQRRLESKIHIISPAIDMIELISARGNTSLESAVSLTKTLRTDIQALGQSLQNAATDEELSQRGSSRAKSKAQIDAELRRITNQMKRLLDKIEDAVPLMNLAITTSGANLSTSLPASVSPSRLLQASTFLSTGDSQYIRNPSQRVQIGPAFTLSVYMLFMGHSFRSQDEEGLRRTTWKEVIHKSRVKLYRTGLHKLSETPRTASSGSQLQSDADVNNAYLSMRVLPAESRADEYGYQLSIIEDLDDGRFHSDDSEGTDMEQVDDVAQAGIAETIPIHEISKIFYADTGKILNINSDTETNNPILLIKRDTNALPPRRMAETDTDQAGSGGVAGQKLGSNPEQETPSKEEPRVQDRRFPLNLDPAWIAFEVFTEEPDSDSDTESELLSQSSPPQGPSRAESLEPNITTALSQLQLDTPKSSSTLSSVRDLDQQSQLVSQRNLSSSQSNMPSYNVQTSLSLLEMLLRLASLQQFQQASHLTINDELLNFFLEESSTTGAGDLETRKRIRWEAQQHLGFDPYDESPIKRRGEQYQYHEGQIATPSQATNSVSRTRSRDTPEPSIGWASSPLLSRSQQSPQAAREALTPDRNLKARTQAAPNTPSSSLRKAGVDTPPDTNSSQMRRLRGNRRDETPQRNSE